MQKIRSFVSSTPFFLAVITLISYGLLIPWLGFYWDDWPFAFLAHNYGPAELIRAFAPFRPFLGPIFFVTFSLLGTSTLAWQIFGLLIRFILAISLWWSLRQVWPHRKHEVLTIVLIFLVFPGFSQQWVSLTHTNQEMIPLIAYLLSFGFTVRAIKEIKHRMRNIVFSLLFQFVGLFATEYYFGYEFIRLVIIYLMVEPSRLIKRLQNALRNWLPNAILWIANGTWLFVYYRSGRYDSYDIQGSAIFNQAPIQFILQLINEIFHSLSTAVIASWSKALSVFQLPLQSTSFLLTFVIVVISFAILLIYHRRVIPSPAIETGDKWAGEAILLGVVGILAGRIPSFAAGLPFEVRFDYDRFFLSIMLGASIFIVGMLFYFLKSGKRQLYVTSLLIALAMGGQFMYANEYRRDAQNQKNLFTQLTWRAPGIKPGTILLTDRINAIPHVSDLGLTGPLNWVYSPNLADRNLPYVLLYTDIRLGTLQLPGLGLNKSVEVDYRTTRFEGNTSDILVFYYPEIGCIKVVDPSNSVLLQEGVLPFNLEKAVRLSNLSRIEPSAEPPALPKNLFGKPIEPNWCYYYQKAELLRQDHNWPQIIQLAKNAKKAGFKPDDPLEWLPFIEAYFNNNDIEQASALLSRVFKTKQNTQISACPFLWHLQNQDIKAPQRDFIKEQLQQYFCGQDE